MPTRQDLKDCRGAIAQGSITGFLVGSVPGGGSTIASFVSYTLQKNISKHPEKFGKGTMEGVAAPEAANNSEVGGAMVPLLSLGLPGSASTSVMLAALLLFGIQPGPRLFETNPEIVWPVIASLYLGNIALIVLNLPMIPLWVRLLKIPYWVLYPAHPGAGGGRRLQRSWLDVRHLHADLLQRPGLRLPQAGDSAHSVADGVRAGPAGGERDPAVADPRRTTVC